MGEQVQVADQTQPAKPATPIKDSLEREAAKKKSPVKRFLIILIVLIILGCGATIFYLGVFEGYSHPYAKSGAWVVSGYFVPGNGESYDFVLDEHGGTKQAVATSPAGTKVIDFELNMHGYPKKAVVGGKELTYWNTGFNEKNGWPMGMFITASSTSANATFQCSFGERIQVDDSSGIYCTYQNTFNGADTTGGYFSSGLINQIDPNQLGGKSYLVNYSNDASGLVNGSVVFDRTATAVVNPGDVFTMYSYDSGGRSVFSCQRDQNGNIALWIDENGNVFKEIRYTYVEKPYVQCDVVSGFYQSPINQFPILFYADLF